jgi:parvulin-like peptidyl-prolyl isomerase
MKYTLAAFLIFLSVSTFGQLGVTQKLQAINTVQQAQDFIAANPQLKPVLLKLSAATDTTIIAKRLLRQNKGDVFSVGYNTYKVLESEGTVDYRASYIFLDGGEYAPEQLDSLKKLIVQQVNSGVSFESLSDKYTMDGNKTRGDTDWFSGEYSFPKEFQDAVQQHKVGEVFMVEVPEKQWNYIVKKTHNDRVKKDATILRAIGR